MLALAALVGCERAASSAPPPAAAPAGAAPTIAYERTVGGNQDLYVTEHGTERRLTDAAGTDMLPRYTRDGRAIYFASERAGNWQIYSMPAAGGPAVRVRTNAHRSSTTVRAARSRGRRGSRPPPPG